MEVIVVNPIYDKNLRPFLENHSFSFDEDEGEIIYAARNTIKVIDVEGMKLNIKIFKTPHIMNQFVYSTFRSSKAERSYSHAMQLQTAGFHTPSPIAYMEYKKLGILLKQSFYISEHMSFDGIMKELYTGELLGREELLKQFAQFSAALHDAQIYHLDFSSGNILYIQKDDKYTFYLVDLNRMDFNKAVSLKKGCACFKRLWGNEEMFGFIIAEYAKARKLDVELCVKEAFKYRNRFWTFFNKKYPNVKPYENNL